MIEVKNLTKIYGGTTVLSIPQLLIRENESFGLVGNNGAGKTTFFRLLLDLIRANSGWIKSKTKDVKGTTDWKFYTGAHLDDGFLIDFLTPEEYFEFIGQVHHMSKGDLDNFYKEYDEFFAGEILDKKKYIRDFSHGNKQKIGVAAALMAKPEIIILDEPFNGLDPSTQMRLIRILNDAVMQCQSSG
jgi:ABC-2 type transport system ATP-binding protein